MVSDEERGRDQDHTASRRNQSPTNKRPRIRATRACQRCSQRKVQCDGAESDIPCRRCRADNYDNCIFVPSRRGTYQRKKRQELPSTSNTLANCPPQNHYTVDTCKVSSGANANQHGLPDGDCDGDTTTVGSPTSKPGLWPSSTHTTGALHTSGHIDSSSYRHGIAQDMELDTRRSITDPSGSDDWSTNFTATDSTNTSVSSRTIKTSQNTSLAAMFEDFLDRQGVVHEGVRDKHSIIFLADSSPLTFALEELQRGKATSLHDVGTHLIQSLENDESSVTPQRSTHPSHISREDINYLKAKGAFDFPKPEILNSLVSAFMERFYPLYSIVDRTKFEQLYKEQKLPWILLHSVCLIGATYCEHSVIHKSGFKGRWHARRLFYDKAKVLFDLGYETDKIVLLQTVLMLTFWGPQMKSYWNPCSWVGFGVTIADSLGIYKSTSSAHMNAADRGLLRRLWWTLASRDAYCAALLGRPFRINMTICDTEMLTLEDFGQDIDRYPANGRLEAQTGATYQIQIVKLSLILRQIVLLRSNPAQNSVRIEALHSMLTQWESELPQIVDWHDPSSSSNIFATSLKIIFHHHLIVMHLGAPNPSSNVINQDIETQETTSAKIAESAAQMISSSALALMMKNMVGFMPHEAFPGFLIAGIVFYRQMKKPQSVLAQLGQAALDNCQIVLNEARERWDAGQWAMRIFDFLVSRTDKTQSSARQNWHCVNTNEQNVATQDDIHEMSMGFPHDAGADSILHSIDLDSPPHQDIMGGIHDINLIPTYFMTGVDYDFNFALP